MELKYSPHSAGLAGKRATLARNDELAFLAKRNARVCANAKCGRHFPPRYREAFKRYMERKTCSRECALEYVKQKTTLKKMARKPTELNLTHWGGGVSDLAKTGRRDTNY